MVDISKNNQFRSLFCVVFVFIQSDSSNQLRPSMFDLWLRTVVTFQGLFPPALTVSYLILISIAPPAAGAGWLPIQHRWTLLINERRWRLIVRLLSKALKKENPPTTHQSLQRLRFTWHHEPIASLSPSTRNLPAEGRTCGALVPNQVPNHLYSVKQTSLQPHQELMKTPGSFFFFLLLLSFCDARIPCLFGCLLTDAWERFPDHSSRFHRLKRSFVARTVTYLVKAGNWVPVTKVLEEQINSAE